MPILIDKIKISFDCGSSTRESAALLFDTFQSNKKYNCSSVYAIVNGIKMVCNKTHTTPDEVYNEWERKYKAEIKKEWA